MLRLPLAFRRVFPRKLWIKKAFLAPGHHAHMLFYDIFSQKILIFIFSNKQEPGFGSLILLLEKSIFSKKSPNWCPGGIITTYNIISRFICAKNVKNQKNIFLNLDAWVYTERRQCEYCILDSPNAYLVVVGFRPWRRPSPRPTRA